MKYFETLLVVESASKVYCYINDTKYNINTKTLKRALHGDKILVKINKHSLAFVQKILERSETIYIGKITNKFIKCWNHQITTEFYTNNPDGVVYFKFKKWEKSDKNPSAEIVKYTDHHDDFEYVVSSNMLYNFSENALYEADNILNKSEERIDLRHLNTISIDPNKTKDIDGAISYEETPNGYRIGVHIADVTAYLAKGSSIDKEAYDRTFAFYHTDFSVPMLPNNLIKKCSFIEHKDRLALSLMINFDREWNIIDKYVFRSIINNKKKFTYSSAEACKNDPLSEYYIMLNTLYTIGCKLRLETFPKEIILHKNEYNSHDTSMCMVGLVQSWMMLANIYFTQRCEEVNTPIYRTQKFPYITDVIKQKISDAGYQYKDNVSISANIRYLIDKCPEIVLSNMKSASYSHKKQHFLLGTDTYTHFTSPIRRYADILNHRILLASLKNKRVETANYDNIYKHLNRQESKIIYVEQKIKHKQFLNFFMENHLKCKVIDQSDRHVKVRCVDTGIDVYIEEDNTDYVYGTQLIVSFKELKGSRIYGRFEN